VIFCQELYSFIYFFVFNLILNALKLYVFNMWTLKWSYPYWNSKYLRFKFVLSVKFGLTPLEGVSHVSFSIFWFLFLFFWILLKKSKKLPRVKLSLCHVAVTEWCGSDNVRCQCYARCYFLSLNLSLYFNFCLNLVLIFVKIIQFRPSPN